MVSCSNIGCWSALRGLKKLLQQEPESESKWRNLPNHSGGRPEAVYDIQVDILGEGSFGFVRRAVHRETGRNRIIKTINKQEVSDNSALRQELSIQAGMDHPYICKLYDTFDVAGQIHISLQFCQGGDLERVIDAEMHLSEEVAHHLMLQIMQGVNYMHGQGVAHLDMKPENVLLACQNVPILENTIKIVDFGFSEQFEPGTDSLSARCGTPPFIAPEIWDLAVDGFNEKVDVWACGVILYNILGGDLPFNGSMDELPRQTKFQRIRMDGEPWDGVSGHAKRCILQMCSVNIEKRLSAYDVLMSPWVIKSPPPANKQHRALLRGMERMGEQTKFQKAAGYFVAMSLPETEQKAVLRSIFLAMDKDGNGTLTIDEIKACHDILGKATQNVVDICSEWVHSHGEKGYITWTEFLSAMASHRFSGLDVALLGTKSACWEAFAALDKDGTQDLSMSEIKKMVEDVEGAELSTEEVEEIMAELGLEQDGTIGFEEFYQTMMCVTKSDYAQANLGACRLPRENSVSDLSMSTFNVGPLESCVAREASTMPTLLGRRGTGKFSKQYGV